MSMQLMTLKRFLIKCWGFIPFSWLGLILLGIDLALWKYYVSGHQDFVILVLSVGIALLMSISLIQIVIAIILFFFQYRQTHHLQSIYGITGQSFWTGYALKRLILLPSIEYRVTWLNPQYIVASFSQKGSKNYEYVFATRRIDYHQVTRRIYLEDMLGLVKFYYDFTLQQKLEILPNTQDISPHQTLQLFTMGDEISHPSGEPVGDYLEMRRYHPGDSINRILWKVYARSKKLLVRTPERAIAHRKKTYAYFISNPQDEPSAQSAWFSLEKGLLGEQYFFATDAHGLPTDLKSEALSQVLASAQSEHDPQWMEQFFFANPETKNCNCVIFAPPTKGEWINVVKRLAQHNSQGVYVLMSIANYHDQAKQNKFKQWFVDSDQQVQVLSEQAKKIYQELHECGVKLNILDYHLGTMVDAKELI